MPVSATPWLRDPDGLTSETGALVAAGNAVGLPALAPDDGTAVGEAVVEPGLVLVLVLVLAAGVAVADDPQANNRATNNRTIALGKCLVNFVPDLVSDILSLPFSSAKNRYVVSTNRNLNTN